MGIAYFIGFCCVGYWIYFNIKKEGILWIPRALTNIGGFVLWGYLSLIIYPKIGIGWLQFLATVGTMIGLVFIVTPINDKLDELTGEKYMKNPNDKNE